MTKKHQHIFELLKKLLHEQFGNELNVDKNGKYLTIGSEIWLSVDETELTIGYGINHRHYDPEYDDIVDALNKFFNMLTKKKRITNYFKGEYFYKTKVEIEIENGNFIELSSSMTWLYPFWKKTTQKIEIDDFLINYCKIESEIAEIINYAKIN